MGKSQIVRIVLAIVVGIVGSFIINAIFIFCGYYHVHAMNLTQFVVNICGIPIYKIVKQNGNYVGQSISANMSFIGIALSIIAIAIEEIFHFSKASKKKNYTR